MALVLADRVRETTTSTGTTAITLAGAYTGFQTFSAAVGTGNSTYYTIANVSTGEWEVGIGTYTSGGNTLSRTTVLASSNSGSLVNFGAGSKDVFVTQPAERALYVASAGTGLSSKVTAFTNGGVVYASDTSTLATGSALTFDGTTFQYTGASNFATSTGNVGIGTSSPSEKLHVVGKIAVSGTNPSIRQTVQNAYLDLCGGTTVGTDPAIQIAGSTTTSDANKIFYNANAHVFRTSSGGSTYATIDTSGNLGLGVTPSAQYSTVKAMQIGALGATVITGNTSAGGTSSFGQNWYVDPTTANFFYAAATSQPASRYSQYAGQHQWFNAAAGTAGNAITFTQAMTLDASGNLGVGSTSPNIAGVNKAITLNTTNGTAGAIYEIAINGTNYAYLFSNASNTVLSSVQNLPLLFNTNNTERARIDSSGNLGVGVTSMSQRLVAGGSANTRIQVDGSSTGGIYFTQSGSNAGTISGSTSAMMFYAPGASESMRLDNSGNLLVGTTSATTGNGGFRVRVNTNGNSGYTNVQSENPTTSSIFSTWDVYASSAYRFYVTYNGGVNNYQANDTNLSDRREKTNFAPAGDYLSKICSIPVQTFNYIDQNLEEDAGLTLGVVAQDVQAVAPELVTESNWGTEEEPKMRLSIYQTDLQYALMKALQELKAEFDAYKASHP